MGRTRISRASTAATVIESTTAAADRIREGVRAQAWWHTALLFIGIVTLATAVGVLFLGIDSPPEEVVTSHAVPPVRSHDFTVALSRLVGAPVEQGGTVEILNNGDEFLPALLRSIDAARRSINFSVYIWNDGTFSDRVIDALERRQREGVAVRVLLDGLGGRKAPDDRFGELEKLGARVEKFRTPRFGTWTRFHRRTHRRAIVIDGQVGFTGGMAVGDSWLGNAEDPDHWRDVMFRLTGPLAGSLQGAFVDAWASSAGEILVGPDTYPVASTLSAPSAPGVERFIHYISSPADDDHSMAYFFLMSVLAARESVYLATPYFIPDDPFKEALKAKARAGVDVRLLLPGPHIDNHSVRFSGQNHYDELIESGVRIHEYQPSFMHAKYGVVDGAWSIIGSPNLNSRSRQLDEENVFGVLDVDLAARLEKLFLEDLGRSKEIRLDAWRDRDFFVRLLQLSARILDQQS
jgi:cardiolipin synthase